MDKRRQPKAFLFDYGGTLDTRAIHWFYVLHKAYLDAGMPLDAETFRPAYVHGERELARRPVIGPNDTFPELLRKKVVIELDALLAAGLHLPDGYDAPEALAEAVAMHCDAFVRTNLREAGKVLRCLRERYRLLAVSNFYGNLRTVLADYGILDCFEDVIESACVGVRKPSPEIFRLAVSRAGLPAQDCVMVGDSIGKDIVPAHAVGCRCVWVKGPGWRSEVVDLSMIDHVVDEVGELLRYY